LQIVVAQKKDYLSEELRRPFTHRFLRPVLNRCFSVFNRLRMPQFREQKKLERLTLRLKMAGIPMPVEEYWAAVFWIRLFVLLSASLLVRQLLQNNMSVGFLIILFAAAVSALGPKYFLQFKINKRQESVRSELPDVLDLLVVSVEAGLGLDSAIVRLSEEKDSPLIRELQSTIRDVSMGISRKSAFKALADRNDIAELRVFIGSLLQAEQLGVSVKSVLSAQANQLRQARKQKLEAKAMKAPVKMMLPTVVFIFPVLFIILLAPAVLKFMNTF
jgi:tight adherence protein C